MSYTELLDPSIMVALFGKKEKELAVDQQSEHAIGRVALPAEGAPKQPGLPPTAQPELAPQPPLEQPVGQEQLPAQPELAPAQPQPSEGAPLPSGGRAQQPAAVQPVAKSAQRKQIEELLADGLTEVYQGMTPQEQEVFRKKGEAAATAIEELLIGFKATARKVVDIIRGWLSTIPRVNRYFLEQESKLKTDQIMKLQRKLKKERRSRIDV